jgi:hypothetical protein
MLTSLFLTCVFLLRQRGLCPLPALLPIDASQLALQQWRVPGEYVALDATKRKPTAGTRTPRLDGPDAALHRWLFCGIRRERISARGAARPATGRP